MKPGVRRELIERIENVKALKRRPGLSRIAKSDLDAELRRHARRLAQAD